MVDAAYHARWRAANRAAYLAAQRRYRERHRVQRRAASRVRRANNLDRHLAKERRFARKHRKRRLHEFRLWRQQHLERERERNRVYRRKVGVTEATKKWNFLNREKGRESARLRGRRNTAFAKIEAVYGTMYKERSETMHNDKMIRFIKQWRELESQRRKLDFERSRWCREVRAEFAKGDVGDRAFINWLAVELGIAAVTGQEMLERAVASSAVPDETTWDRVGGFSNIRALAPLPQRDKVAVLEAAKADAKTVKAVMRERGLATRPKVTKPDVVLLAEFIATLDKVPPAITAIVSKYVTRKAFRRAAGTK